MICNKCGKKNKDDALFCVKCNAILENNGGLSVDNKANTYESSVSNSYELNRESEKEPKPFNGGKIIAVFLILGLTSLFFGCLWGMGMLIACGAFLTIFPTAIAIAVHRDRAIAEKHGDQAQEVFKKKNKRGWVTVLLLIVVTVVLAGVLLSFFVESEVEKEGICKSCDREFTDSDNTHSIAKTGMCENCYGNFKDFEQFIDD